MPHAVSGSNIERTARKRLLDEEGMSRMGMAKLNISRPKYLPRATKSKSKTKPESSHSEKANGQDWNRKLMHKSGVAFWEMYRLSSRLSLIFGASPEHGRGEERRP